jgi:hypothetical protein
MLRALDMRARAGVPSDALTASKTQVLYLKDAQVHTRRRLTRPESISLVDDVLEATVARNERRCLWASS